MKSDANFGSPLENQSKLNTLILWMRLTRQSPPSMKSAEITTTTAVSFFIVNFEGDENPTWEFGTLLLDLAKSAGTWGEYAKTTPDHYIGRLRA